jgi:hypothetical protein
MEWWSNGVMKGEIQVEMRVFVFANTPILQYSSTPRELAILNAHAVLARSHGTGLREFK